MKQFLICSAIFLLLFIFGACGSDDNPVVNTGHNFDPFALWDTASGRLGGTVQCLAAKDTFLYAGTADSGVYVSINNGTSWVKSAPALNVFTILVKDTVLLAGTSNRVYRSTDKGLTWAAFGTGITPAAVYSLARKDTNLFVGTNQGVYRSTDGGATWSASGLGSYTVRTFGLKKKVFFAGTSNGVYKSTDNGTNWTQIITDLVGPNVYALAAMDTFLIAATQVDIFRTSNDSSWTLVGDGLPSGPVPTSFFVTGSSLLVGLSNYEGVYLSVNNGASWISCNAGFPMPFTANAFLYNGAFLFVGGINQGAGGGVWRHGL